MDRRRFMIGTAAGGAAALGAAAGYLRWQELPQPSLIYPGREEGHWLRDRLALPPPSAELRTDIAILGSGVAGLSAAWTLARRGHGEFLVLDGPERFGNAASGEVGELAYPTGAHYLPLPSIESFHVRAMLADLGVLQGEPGLERPEYDERYIIHAPQERVLVDGNWQDGILPTPRSDPTAGAQQERFFAFVEKLKDLRGSDGRRIFVVPSILSSTDAEWRLLDGVSFRTWLGQNGYDSPALHWYLNYCCRDDYGTGYQEISAWAGLHYFAARDGLARNADRGAVLTWPQGLGALASGLAARSGVRTSSGDDALLRGMRAERGPRSRAGTAIHVEDAGDCVRVLCFELVNGKARTFTISARKIILAMPLFVAARVYPAIKEFGFDPASELPPSAAWMVSNFLLEGFPEELPGAPLAWDNVVYQEPGLGYVVSTHQDIRVSRPERTIFSAYDALSGMTPATARRWLESASPADLLERASADLKLAYGWRLAPNVRAVEITVRGHAMAAPTVGFRSNRGLAALRDADGPVLFAHADLSSLSVFEEASWWGVTAAYRALGLGAVTSV